MQFFFYLLKDVTVQGRQPALGGFPKIFSLGVGQLCLAQIIREGWGNGHLGV